MTRVPARDRLPEEPCWLPPTNTDSGRALATVAETDFSHGEMIRGHEASEAGLRQCPGSRGNG